MEPRPLGAIVDDPVRSEQRPANGPRNTESLPFPERLAFRAASTPWSGAATRIHAMDFETRAIHVGQEPDSATGAVTTPI